MDLLRPTHLKINLNNLMDNFRFLKGLQPEGGFICPMVKANAYGHGDLSIAKALQAVGGEYVGVSSVEEGLHLRISEQANQILVFGFSGEDAVKEMVQNQLTPVVSDFDQLGHVCLVSQQAQKIHLKFDTGMHRLGFQSHEVQGVIEVLKKNPNLEVEGLCTHLYEGANTATPGESSHRQVELFGKIISQFKPRPRFCHVYNSAAIASLYLNKKKYAYGFRPGLLAYGIDPEPNQRIKPLISPVMEFKSKIVTTQQVKSGEVVSYGGIWKAAKDSVIGIVPAGYADGVCRSLSSAAEFLVRGQRVPLRGRVCMDYTMVDLTELVGSTNTLKGEEVVIIGQQGEEIISVEEIANKSGRIHYEVLTSISERVPRYYGAGQ